MKARCRRTLRQAADGSGTCGYSAVLRGYLGGTRVPDGAAADGSAWTTVLSKAGGATVRGCAHKRLSLCCVRLCMGAVQFAGNADPQNKVTNEFAAPVLARYIVRYST